MPEPLRRLYLITYSWVEPNLRSFLNQHQPAVWGLAMIVGLGTGMAAVLFRIAIGLVQWPWLGDLGEHVASAARAQPWWVVLIAPAAGGLVVGLILQYLLPSQRAGTVSDVMEARVYAGRGLSLRAGLGSAVASAVSLGSGASAGREGPVVHLGATIAASLCRWFNLPDAAKRTLLACGVAGAISASFNAPIAGVLFAQEVILAHFAATSFVPLVIASVAGAIVSRLAFGDVAAFEIPAYQITSYWEFPAFALLGIVCAAVAVTFQVALIGSDWLARHLTMPLWLRPVVGGLLVGAIAIFFPHVLGVGYEATDAALKHQLPVLLMLSLIVAKGLATAITLASRFGGGVVSPSLYLGAMTGGAFGALAAGVFPGMASSEGLYAILGMGAVAAAVLGAPISTAVMVFELTGGFALAIALLITVAIANGLALAVHGRAIFHWQLEMRGLFLHEGPHRYLVRNVRVGQFMDPLAEGETASFDPAEGKPYLRVQDTLESALRAFDSSRESRIPVVRSEDIRTVVGWASQVRALRYFNRELIQVSVEEHR